MNSFNPSFSHSNHFKVASKSQIKLEKSNQCRLWEKFLQNSIYRTVSIKRPYLIFFQKSLLNVPYDRKKEDLNILSYRSYNRVVRVLISKLWKSERSAFLKFFHAFLKFDLPKAHFLNFPQNSTPSLIGPFLIIGDCVYTGYKNSALLVYWFNIRVSL